MPIKDQSGDTPNGAMIAVRDLRKAIGDEEILRGVNLDIAVAETLAIIGRSGGGKSVLLKHLIGLMQPDAGEIWVSGKNIIGMSERQLTGIRQKVGILFQKMKFGRNSKVAELTADSQQTYVISQGLARDPESSHLRPVVASMKDALGVARPRRKKKAEPPALPHAA